MKEAEDISRDLLLSCKGALGQNLEESKTQKFCLLNEHLLAISEYVFHINDAVMSCKIHVLNYEYIIIKAQSATFYELHLFCCLFCFQRWLNSTVGILRWKHELAIVNMTDICTVSGDACTVAATRGELWVFSLNSLQELLMCLSQECFKFELDSENTNAVLFWKKRPHKAQCFPGMNTLRRASISPGNSNHS